MPGAPLLIFDGDCGFCTRSVDWLVARTGSGARTVPYQWTDLSRYGVTARRADHEALWVDADGQVHGGARAFARLLATGSVGWRVAGAALDLPVVRPLATVGYRLVARVRHRLPGGTAACRVRPRETGDSP